MTVRAIVLLIGIALSACAGGAPVDAVARWDGRWVGHFESSLGLLGCPARTVLDITVNEGRMAGGGSTRAMTISLSGTISPTGEIREGVFNRDGKAAAVMAGTFTPREAAGRWQGSTCEGTWRLQRFP
ncbi:MAG: hypothetical protein WD767_15880 [Alphaproteobacteria bacterium]